MGTVRDPNFWRRFSIAVHQDNMQKEEMAKRPDLKHSYVSTSNSTDPYCASPSPVTTPTSQSHLSPAFPPPACTSSPLSPMTSQPHTPRRNQGCSQPTTPTTQSLLRTPSRRLQKEPPSPLKPHQDQGFSDEKEDIKPRPSPRRPSLAHTTRSGRSPFFARHTNASQLTLGFSGRPPSRFKFWTSITADPSNRDSWLESQRKKQRQRTWMCWVFWICFLLLVAGVVVAILLLNARGII